MYIIVTLRMKILSYWFCFVEVICIKECDILNFLICCFFLHNSLKACEAVMTKLTIARLNNSKFYIE